MPIQNGRIVDLVAKLGVHDFLERLFGGVAEKTHTGHYESLNEGERILYCIYSLSGEVHNGGFSGFFFNAAGTRARDLPWALEQIGADLFLPMVTRALACFPGSQPPQDQAERRQVMERLGEKQSKVFNELDEEFFRQCGYWSHPTIETMLFEYVCRHMESFTEPERPA